MSFNIAGAIRELLLPPQSIFLLFVFGMLAARRRPRVGFRLCATALGLLFLLCTGIGAWCLVTPLEAMTKVPPSLNGTGAQAIVVLAAGRYKAAPEYGGEEIPDYVALARLRYAAKIHRSTGLPILVSGGGGTPDGDYKPLAASMAKALQGEFGLPVKWLEDRSVNTDENAQYSSRILKREGIRRVFLVTDAMHMPRAELAFRQSSIEIVSAPTIFFGTETPTSGDFWLSAENLRRSSYAVYEWLGLAWYTVRYRLRDS